jgi:hypothetical protein
VQGRGGDLRSASGCRGSLRSFARTRVRSKPPNGAVSPSWSRPRTSGDSPLPLDLVGRNELHPRDGPGGAPWA